MVILGHFLSIKARPRTLTASLFSPFPSSLLHYPVLQTSISPIYLTFKSFPNCQDADHLHPRSRCLARCSQRCCPSWYRHRLVSSFTIHIQCSLVFSIAQDTQVGAKLDEHPTKVARVQRKYSSHLLFLRTDSSSIAVGTPESCNVNSDCGAYSYCIDRVCNDLGRESPP